MHGEDNKSNSSQKMTEVLHLAHDQQKRRAQKVFVEAASVGALRGAQVVGTGLKEGLGAE